MLFSAQRCTPLFRHVFTILCFICCCSVSKSCLTLCDPTDCSTPSSSVLHYLQALHYLQWAQTHCYWVSDAIPPSHDLLSLSPSTLNLSQHQGLFQRICASHIRCPKYWSFGFSISPSNEYSGFPWGLTGLFSPILCTYLWIKFKLTHFLDIEVVCVFLLVF